jgi:hypothetical protein
MQSNGVCSYLNCSALAGRDIHRSVKETSSNIPNPQGIGLVQAPREKIFSS